MKIKGKALLKVNISRKKNPSHASVSSLILSEEQSPTSDSGQEDEVERRHLGSSISPLLSVYVGGGHVKEALPKSSSNFPSHPAATFQVVVLRSRRKRVPPLYSAGQSAIPCQIS